MRQHLLKTISIAFVFLLIFSLIGCSSNSASKKEDSVQKTKTTESKKDNKKTKTAKADKSAETATTGKQNSTDTSEQASTQPGTTAKNSTPSVNAQTSQSQTTTNTGTSKQSPSTSAAAPAASQTPVQTVKVSIIGPKDKGTILSGKSVSVQSGDMVLDVLFAAVGKGKVDWTGSGATAYVRGIDNIYEFDYGPTSGWTYSLNGNVAGKSAGTVKVSAGDQVEWIYKEN